MTLGSAAQPATAKTDRRLVIAASALAPFAGCGLLWLGLRRRRPELARLSLQNSAASIGLWLAVEAGLKQLGPAPPQRAKQRIQFLTLTGLSGVSLALLVLKRLK